MLTRWGRRTLGVWAAAFCLLTLLSCERSPLFAPAGSTITLTSPTTVLSPNGTATLVAQVIEESGFPPHSGTRVLFTTTLGTIEPNQAETNSSGIATVTFRASSSNGTAKITATSGTATTGTDGALSIAVGTAAVGRVTLTANPNVIQSNGGSSVVTASVLDVNGSALPGVPVSFSTSAGALSSSIAVTDFVGSAITTLTTSTNATVTATVGVSSGTGTGNGGTGTGGTGTGGSTAGQAQATVTISVNAQPTVSINPTTTGVLTAGTPITFAVTVQNATGSVSQIRNVTLNFGDGTGTLDLGALTGTAIPQQHVFPNSTQTMTYTVRLTATDTLNATTSAATTVVIQPQPPLSASFTFTQNVAGPNTLFQFNATVTPNTTTVQTYEWNFGDGSADTTTSPQITHSYPTGSGAKTVTLKVTATDGSSTTTSRSVVP